VGEGGDGRRRWRVRWEMEWMSGAERERSLVW